MPPAMGMYGYQAAEHFRQRAQQVAIAITSYEQLSGRAREVGARSRAALEAAAGELARAYLSALTPAVLERVERLTGFVGFKRHDPIKAMEHERHVLVQNAQRIAQDHRYVQRELLAGPDGTLRSKIDQARELMEPFHAECAKFEQLEGFLELVQVGYDTPAYAASWLQKDYWRRWAAGDRICAELGMNDFGDDVLPAYQKVAAQRDFWRNEIAELERQLAHVHQLVQRHDEAYARARGLDEAYLVQCHDVLARHLAEADVALLDEWHEREGEDRGVRMALRKLSGLRAKSELMHELLQNGIDPVLEQLKARGLKYQQKAVKFDRAKHRHISVPESALDMGFDEKYQKLQTSHAKLGVLIERVAAYDDYARFDLDNDPDLWWHAFSGGKAPPRALPRLQHYYRTHPNAAPRYDDMPAENAAAVALAAREASRQDDMGYLS